MKIWKITTLTYRRFHRHRARAEAAALAYYALFSLGPVLLIAIGIGGLWLGEDVARQQIMYQVNQIVGSEAQDALGRAVDHLTSKSNNLASIAVGSAILLVGASGAFSHVHGSMNRLWGIEVEVHLPKGVLLWIRKRLLSFALVLISGAVMLSALAANTFVAVASQWLASYLVVPPWAVRAAEFAGSMVLLSLLLCVVYHLLPDAKVRWRYTLAGALLAGVGLNVCKSLIGLYLAHNVLISAYGAAGAIVLVLVWLYVSGLVFYLGVEFTYVLARVQGHPVRPARYLHKRPK